jgi:hypothetical protein
MKSKFVQWILSKLFPYNGISVLDAYNTDSEWDKQKRHETEEFYGGNDGTRR